MNEAGVSKKLREELLSQGAVCWKTSDRFHASRPDLFVAYNGECAFIEMKLWPNTPTPLQSDTLNQLAAVGLFTYTGTFDVEQRLLYIKDWVTLEVEYFHDIKEAAQWLLKQLS